MATSEKRNQAEETEQIGVGLGASAMGVGGRQATSHLAWGGVGTKESAPGSNFGAARPAAPRDPRLDELRDMGLPRAWREVAEAIGMDAFLTMWRILDEDESRHDDNMINMSIRPYRSYLHFQRNRYIETLSALGIPSFEIRSRLRKQLGEDLTERHISRLAKRR